MSNGILIYAEVTREGYLHPVFFELAQKAFALTKKLDNSPLMAIIMTKPNVIQDFKEVFRLNGFDKVFYFPFSGKFISIISHVFDQFFDCL